MNYRRYTYRWLKAQKKYCNLHRRLQAATNQSLIHQLQNKLTNIKKRLLAMNLKWRLGVATSFLLAWPVNLRVVVERTPYVMIV